MTFTVKR